MKLQVLGCHGGELPHHRSTCFLVDDVLAIDAGALCSTLDLEALARVDDILLTHSHFDHIKDIPMVADLLAGRRKTPIRIHCVEECAQTLSKNVFNDLLWPNFTQIPDARNPVLSLCPFRAGSTLQIGNYEVSTVAVNHAVASCGFVIRNEGVSIGISGDTGPTDGLWQLLNASADLQAVLIECSFPDEFQGLADVSGHLTPQTLKGELEKFHQRDAQVFLYHLKAGLVPQLKVQLKDMAVRILELDEVFEFKVDVSHSSN